MTSDNSISTSSLRQVASDASDSLKDKDGERQTSEGALVEKVERQIVAQLEKHLPDRPVEPSEFAQALARVVAVEIREIVVSFSGPLPPPAMLKEYEAALPGLAERIVARAEKEQTFRHEMAREQLSGIKRRQWHDSTRAYIGQAGAFVLSMTAIGGGIALLAVGKSTAGLGSIIAALVTLAAVFLGAKITDAIAKHRKPDAGDDNE